MLLSHIKQLQLLNKDTNKRKDAAIE